MSDEITIQQKAVTEWTAYDFVGLFKRLFEQKYGRKPELVYGKECIVMGRLVTKFRQVNRSKAVVRDFLHWAFEHYDDRVRTIPLTIGFLAYMVPEFIPVNEPEHVSTKKTKKSSVKLTKVELSSDVKSWLANQKRLYRRKKDAK